VVVIGRGGMLGLGLMLENWLRGDVWWGEFTAGKTFGGGVTLSHTVGGIEWGKTRAAVGKGYLSLFPGGRASPVCFSLVLMFYIPI